MRGLVIRESDSTAAVKDAIEVGNTRFPHFAVGGRAIGLLGSAATVQITPPSGCAKNPSFDETVITIILSRAGRGRRGRPAQLNRPPGPIASAKDTMPGVRIP